MKTLIYTLLLFFVLGGCVQKNNLKQEQKATLISDKISVCRMYRSDFILLDPNERGILFQEFRFNRNGFVNELVRYNLDGEVVGLFNIYGENNPFPINHNYQFADTVLTITEVDDSGNISVKEVKTYNTDGLLTETCVYDEFGKMFSKNTYAYNKSGLIKEDIYWDIELNKAKEMIRYEYDYFTD